MHALTAFAEAFLSFMGLIGVSASIIIAFLVGWAWRQRKLIRGLERDYGLTVLPYRTDERSRVLRIAQRNGKALGQELVSGDLSGAYISQAVQLTLHVSRPLATSVIESITQRRAQATKEVFSDRAEGRSFLMAEVAHRLSSSHLVLWSNWPDLANKWKEGGGKVPLATHELLFLKCDRLRLFSRTVVVIDDCPPRDGDGTEVQKFRSFKEALDRAGLTYVIGVPRTRIPIAVEHWKKRTARPPDHQGWLGESDQFHLHLQPEEYGSLVRQWQRLSGVPTEDKIKAFLKRNIGITNQFHALHDALWKEQLRRIGIPRPKHTRDYIALAGRLTAQQRLALEWIALGQLVSVAVPEAGLISVLGGMEYTEFWTLMRGYVRRDNDDLHGLSGAVILHLGGPHWAQALLEKYLNNSELLSQKISEVIRWSTNGGRADTREAWRAILHRLAGTFPSPISKDVRAATAKRVYHANHDLLLLDSTIQSAAIRRRLGDTRTAGIEYRKLWEERRRENSSDLLADISLAVGLKDTAPDVIAEAEYLDFVLRVADKLRPSGPKVCLGIADAIFEAIRAGSPDSQTRDRALGKAEKLARFAMHSPYSSAAHNMLARLVGGLAGAYRFGAAERPSLVEALQLAKGSFEHSEEETLGRNKSLQDARTYHCIYQLYKTTGRHTDEALVNLRHSLFDLTSRSLNGGELQHQIARLFDLAEYIAETPTIGSLQQASEYLDAVTGIISGKDASVRLQALLRQATLLRRFFPEQLGRISAIYRDAIDISTEDAKASVWISWLYGLRDYFFQTDEQSLNRATIEILKWIEYADSLLPILRASSTRERIAKHLGIMFFVKSRSSHRKRRFGESCSARSWDSLLNETERASDNLVAAASLVLIADNYTRVLGNERIARFENLMLGRAKDSWDYLDRVKHLLEKELARKSERKLPCGYNQRLVALIATEE